jgi:GH35 family endo-1,4-beta-xylanase
LALVPLEFVKRFWQSLPMRIVRCSVQAGAPFLLRRCLLLFGVLNLFQAMKVGAVEVSTYVGREPAAAWRAQASAAIEQNRKANFTIELKDAHGFPMAGVPVELRLVRHDFAFGAAVSASQLLAVGQDGDRYRGVITQWFNSASLLTDLDWARYEADPARAEAAVNWLRERDIRVRGQSLIRPGTNHSSSLPQDVPALFADVPRLRHRINTHLTNILDRFRGRIGDWDVVNGPLHEQVIEGIMGRAEVVSWFQLAQSVDPSARLHLSDFGSLEGPTREDATRLRNYADALRNLGAPVDGLGLQAHFTDHLTPPTELMARLDLISGIHSGTGAYPLWITEFDVDLTDEMVQADYTRDFLTVSFSHPSVTGLISGEFWEKPNSRPRAALLRRDWETKPNAVAWSNLVHQTWTTRTNVRSTASGKAVVRGFKGEYEVTIRLPGTNIVHRARLGTSTPFRPTLPVLRPELQVIPGDLFEFRWPRFASGYRLETSDVPGEGSWGPVDGIAMLAAEGWRVQLPAPDHTQYYRLRRGDP